MKNRNGFTLMELIAVIVILGIVASVAMRTIDKSLDNARFDNTRIEMDQLVYAISGNPDLFANGMRTDFGYVGDVGAMPSSLNDLVTDPGYSTWDGPYVSSDFAQAADDYKRDAWGELYTYNVTNIESSGGSGGTLTRSVCSSVADLTQNSVLGSITDAAGNPPGDSSTQLSVILQFPDGAGALKDSIVSVSSGGAFSYSNSIPIGNHKITAVYLPTNDTVYTYISVLPSGESYASLRFPGALWAASSGGGGGGPSGNITYVSGSANVDGGSNRNVNFQITNGGSSQLTITWLIATYTHSPTPYYERVRWGGSTVFDSSSPRAASADTVTFSSPKTINVGATQTVQLQRFRDSQTGGGSWVNMANIDFTVEFSDGSVVTFNSGT
ncbi:MAG: prepilin-type N-terminal cleavage/methylation domain-containing protein [candidate division Zixibacteria bacterium]|nr:prepilin-type N-terminal cleavage/methylation domain-containing protein [candidate division Zixibacteria bacterium]MBU1469726.1 prepilin-type N-terminal cleavage/methylation domain-containing protein [candidate division Zixibacteria bacterium]MBU2625224.1 prepilin-type N-terminal cleavage/methylation domain-containing protein [candidate division Zixibacteria bacterium]